MSKERNVDLHAFDRSDRLTCPMQNGKCAAISKKCERRPRNHRHGMWVGHIVARDENSNAMLRRKVMVVVLFGRGACTHASYRVAVHVARFGVAVGTFATLCIV